MIMPNKSIFIIYEKDEDLKSSSFEILGYTTLEEEANRIVDELEERESKCKRNYSATYSWQEMVLGDDCLDNIKPREWPIK